MKAEAFVIHLARAQQRRSQVEKLRQSLPMPVNVVDAVDGQQMSPDEIGAVYLPNLHRPCYPFELGRGEVACFLSHRKAWRAIVERDLDAGLVIEDDVEIDVGMLEQVVNLNRGVLRPRDYLRFPQELNEKGVVVAGGKDVAIFKPTFPGLGMVMQLVGRDAAAALLAETELFDRPVDTTIQLCRNDIRILSSRPVCVCEISARMGGSVIQRKRKGLREIITREFKRAIYRAKVRRSVTASR